MTRTNDSETHREVRELTAGCLAPAEMVRPLAEFFGRYGAIQRVTLLNGGDEPFFLVDFDGEKDAMTAANSSGFPLFGFRSLIIDLRSSA